MKKFTIISSLPLVLFASCVTKTEKLSRTLVPVPQDEGGASFGEFAGSGMPKGKWVSRGSSNVLQPEQVEAYPIARYQDPSNPNIMHERHFVYRKQAQKWNLTPNTSEQVNLGNVPERGRIIDGRIAEKISESALLDAIIVQRDLLREQEATLRTTASNERDIKQLNANQKKLAEMMVQLSGKQRQVLQGRLEQEERNPERRSGDQSLEMPEGQKSGSDE